MQLFPLYWIMIDDCYVPCTLHPDTLFHTANEISGKHVLHLTEEDLEKIGIE